MGTSSTERNKTGPGLKLAVILFWLIVWQLAYLAVGEELLLASPFSVIQRLASLSLTAEFWLSIVNSCQKIMMGYLLGIVTGCLLGVLTGLFPPAYEFIRLPMNIIKATPVASFIILALIWIKSLYLSLFVSFLMVVPIVWTNIHRGIQETDRSLLEMAQVFRLSRRTVAKVIYLPGILPYLLSAAQVSLGLAWKAGIAGEVLATPKNFIGTQLYTAKVYLLTDDLFAWTAVIILLSMIIEKLFVLLLSRLAGTAAAEPGKRRSAA